jgi:hypothetical protein
MSRARQKRFGNWVCWPIHHWIRLQASKSLAGSLKYSSSSFMEGFSFLQYQAVKGFWREPMIGEVWVDGEAMEGGVEMAAHVGDTEHILIFSIMRSCPFVPPHARNQRWKLNHKDCHYWLVIRWKYTLCPFLTHRWPASCECYPRLDIVTE